MKTNFFENILSLGVTGSMNMTINPQADSTLAVSFYLGGETVGDKASKLIPPMIFQATASELDEQFFTAIENPVKKTVQLFANMDEYQKGLDKAKELSKIEQDKKNKAGKGKVDKIGQKDSDPDEGEETEDLFSTQEADKKQKEEKKRQYEEAMKRVGELNTQMKYAEAIEILPRADDHPDKSEEIGRKLADLQRRKKMFDDLKSGLGED